MSREKGISTKEKIRAATNSPELSEVGFTLGDREFKIVDLEYDDYVAFLSHMQPLAEAFLGKITALQGLDLPETSSLNAASLVAYCADRLPEMVRLCCRGTDPSISVEEVKRLGKNPLKLAAVVLAQINQNEMIKDFSDFFGLILPLLKSAGVGTKK